MLSILIPSYQYDCSVLKQALEEQCRQLDTPSEIIVGDKPLPRAAHRNALADAAKGDWLLMIDADARVDNPDFLKSYVDAQKMGDVVCGGLYHPETNPNPQATLRYKYEKKADKHRSAAERNRNPYLDIATFSIMIRHDVFDRIRFDETITEYGYEDVLLGAELQKKGIKVVHIDNPLCHMGLESNDIYLDKIETALRTAKKMGDKVIDFSRIATTARKVEKWHIAPLYRWFYRVTNKQLRKNLLSNNPSLTLLKIYKLGYFLNLTNEQT